MPFDLSAIKPVYPTNTNSTWKFADYLGALKARSSIGRNNYSVEPGLYKLGNPGKESDVLVSANYKLSFDLLRKQIRGLNAWILVLDTKGINVWCAAGKGTFGTETLIRQINSSNLKAFVDHRRIIVPQLGAPGVAAHKVKSATGFIVKFGPVYATDIKTYIENGYQKDDTMRHVHFNMWDRFVLTPVEIANSLKYLILLILGMFIISGLNTTGFSFDEVLKEGMWASVFVVSAYISGAFLGPLVLPWLPFRSFGGKGLVIGLVTYLFVLVLYQEDWLSIRNLGFLLLYLAISSFLTLNFTGSSTYTSLSGVRKEMRVYLPVNITLASIGLILFVSSQFF